MSAARQTPIEDSPAILKTVGSRVQEIRKQNGLSRRLLSEKSGVSPRYLAQLESGEGNISIALLARISTALDYRIEWFFQPSPTNPFSTSQRLLALLNTADADTLQQVTQLLQSATSARDQRLCLIGLRGAGKSTLGRLAGKTLDVPFVELNREIENFAGIPVSEIMALYGPDGYRDLEAQALELVAKQYERVILAAAGGIVINDKTYRQVLSQFHCVWLKASPTEHMERVRAQGDTRPMEGNPQAMQQLRKLLTERENLYSKAAITVDTTDATVEDTLAILLQQINPLLCNTDSQ